MKYNAVPFLIFICCLPDAAQAHSFNVPYGIGRSRRIFEFVEPSAAARRNCTLVAPAYSGSRKTSMAMQEYM